MLASTEDILDCALEARDGTVGDVVDVYFDDAVWVVRYLVADGSAWLPDREVLVAPEEVSACDLDGGIVRVSLTRDRIEAGPPVEKGVPVSRRKEAELAEYYDWIPYWSPMAEELVGLEGKDQEGPRLRSFREIVGYHLRALDGSVGHLEGLIVQTKGWAVRYVVVNTRDLLTGRQVIVSPEWVEEVDWAEERVYLDLSCREIENSPEYRAGVPISRAYEEELHDHYGRDRYWD